MRLSEKQLNDIKVCEYFIPQCFKNIPISDKDKVMFIEHSDMGKHRDIIDGTRRTADGFHALLEGKKWRGIHIHEMYEPGLRDVPYSVLLEGMPHEVMCFMKKEMFKGTHADLIESAWNQINN